MSDYRRSTQEIKSSEIPAVVAEALQAYIEKYNLGAPLDDAKLCVVSTSEKIKKGLFGAGAKPLIQTLILSENWLIIVYQEDSKAPYVRAMQLREITIEDYEKSAAYKLIPDTGLNVSGHFSEATELSSLFLPLGKDEAGEKFKSALIAAAQKAKKQ
ncbi:MAG: hypothetical protein LC099_02620 [Anaerolineales bacterium]|nr:hypothetical protein [Anaerolineales bacterium]